MTFVAPVDLSVPEGSKEWVRAAVEAHGRIDVLYNNASNARFAPFGDQSPEDYQFTIANELDIVWYSCQAAWPIMVSQGGGTIVNVSSISGMLGNRVLVDAAHAVAKGALFALTRKLAGEGAAHGIRANTVTPGVIATEANLQSLLGMENSPVTPMLARTLTGQAGAPDAVPRAALFLASDDSSYITGQNLVVDGGATVLA